MYQPEEISHASQSQLSLCQQYGGCYINGKYYVYDQARDALLLHSVAVKREREAKKKLQQDKINAKAAQGRLF